MPLTTNVVRGARAERLLVLLHGLGADERDLAALVPHLDPEGRFHVVLPRGQYAAPPGYAWYQFGGSPAQMAATLESSLRSLEEVLDEVCDVQGLPREEAVFGGFSQGAATALALALRASEKARPAAVLMMSGFWPPDERISWGWEAGGLPPVLVQHGTEDPLVPLDRGREVAETLASHGVPVVWRQYPMEHNVTLDSVRDAADWLGRVVRGERPSEDLPADPPPSDDKLVRDVGSSTFDAEVLRSPVPVIVDFWAPWCQPCRMVSPVVEQIAAMRKGSYKVVKVNIDQSPDLAQRYEIQSIPLVALFRNGRLERRSMGAKPRPQMEAELGLLVIP